MPDLSGDPLRTRTPVDRLAVPPPRSLRPATDGDLPDGLLPPPDTDPIEPAVYLTITRVNGVALAGGVGAFTGDEPGAPFTVSGTFSAAGPLTVKATRVTVSLGGDTYPADSFPAARSGTWTATVRALRPGPTPLVATVLSTMSEVTGDASATVNVGLLSAVPVFQLTGPPADTVVPLPLPGGGSVQVSATTSAVRGPRSFSVTGGSATVGLPATGPGTAAGPVPLPPSAVGPHTLTVTCRDVLSGSTASRTVTVVGTDVTAPTVRVSYPAAGGQIVATPPGSQTCTFVLRGTAADDQSGMVDGAAGVRWALSPTGAPQAAQPAGPAAPGRRDLTAWSATVTVTGLGASTLYVWGTDAAGNATGSPVAVPFQVVSGYAAGTLTERLDGRAYLAALLGFANEQVSTGAGALTTAVAADALGQPVDRISQPLSREAEVSRRAVNQLRVPVEVMRRFMAARGITGGSGQAGYLDTAYATLLAAYGTTPAELQLARGAADADRQALAARLGVRLSGSRPDQLDALLLTGAARTESALQDLFGLTATTAGLDPLRDVPAAALPTWRRTAQAQDWAAQDATPPRPRTFGALLDPDVVGAADVAPGPTAAAVTALLAARAQRLTGVDNTLRTLQTGAATPAAGLDAMLTKVLPGVDLAALETTQRGGGDIEPQLTAAGLTQSGFALLRQVTRLAATGTVSVQEWDDARAVLVGAAKQGMLAGWRAEERTALPGAAPVVVGPDHFVVVDTAPTVNPYRVHPLARADWQALLRTRIGQRQQLGDGSAAAVAGAEQAALPVLRDGLVRDIGAALALGGDVAEQLTALFQIDVKAAGTLRTTRLNQAAESLQSLLFAIRSGQLPAGHPAKNWTLSAGQPAFDAAWRWLGRLGSWQSATQAYLFPEQYRDPTLLISPGTPLDALWQSIRGSGQFSPADAVARGNAYLAACRAATPGFPTFGYPVGQRTRAAQNTLAALPLTEAQAREALWAVPMLLAQQLQAAGEHLAALDWYWLLYSYDLPMETAGSAHPATNGELTAVLNLPGSPIRPDLTFTPDWLSRLNPFTLGRTFPNLRATLLALVRCLLDFADAEFARESDDSVARARGLYLTAQQVLGHRALQPLTPANPGESALPLPVLGELTSRAAVQLAKLRQGRNIAGMPRAQGVASAGLNQPTPYRYKVLLERARQLTGLAGQVEGQYLAALEKYDAKTLQVNDARNALATAGVQVAVQTARVAEATDAISAAVAQKTRADTLVGEYQRRVDAPPNRYEQALLAGYPAMMQAKNVIAVADSAIGIANAASSAANIFAEVGSFGVAGASQAVVAAGYVARGIATGVLNDLERQMQANQLMAGVEQRRDEWRLQRASAAQDSLIAAAQVTVARDQAVIAARELDLVNLQASQADATLTLLTTQFTNADLYRWMSVTLGQVYRSLLQQATSVARLAQAQLAFERAEPGMRIIGDAYWQAAGQTSDRNGLTAAERLLDDLTQLDQYAFNTDQRRMNLSQTFSLSGLMPTEFLDFRRTGQLSFATPMSLFDQDFPGHYLRLVRQVRVSLVALVPPTRGIRATLASNGVSRVVAPTAAGFTDVVLRREPTQVALTSPVNATGVFELDLQSEMLLPFEGAGVATSWQLDLPLAANPFDFDSIADVLFTVEYTALNDAGYRSQVVDRLNADRGRSSDCVFSLARDFPDAWYDLNNTAGPERTVTVELTDADFPVHLRGLLTTAVGVQLVGAAPAAPTVVGIRRGPAGGDATTTPTGYASSRLANAPAWTGLAGTPPTGSWQLTLRADAFAGDGPRDVLLVVGWQGQAPAWPL